MLGFGRALGETMALAMLIGNSNQISLSLFSPANTLAVAARARTFRKPVTFEVQALMYAALVLLAITLVVNVIGVTVMLYTIAQVRGKDMSDSSARTLPISAYRSLNCGRQPFERRALSSLLLTLARLDRSR